MRWNRDRKKELSFWWYWVMFIELQLIFPRDQFDKERWKESNFQMRLTFYGKCHLSKSLWRWCRGTCGENYIWGRAVTDIWAIKSGDQCGAMGHLSRFTRGYSVVTNLISCYWEGWNTCSNLSWFELGHRVEIYSKPTGFDLFCTSWMVHPYIIQSMTEPNEPQWHPCTI